MVRRKVKKRTEEESCKYLMDQSLEKCRKERIPDPTRFHEVGDEVRYGNWDWSAILDVLDEGKIYKVFSINRCTKRNVPDYTEFKFHYMPWYEFVPQMDYDSLERLTQTDDIRFNYAQRDVQALIYMSFDKYGLDFEADYQRGNVWTKEQKVSLIDSIYRNVDIGKFAIIRRPWGDNPNIPATPLLYEVLDGKQRITALLDFYLNRFKYKDTFFSELHPFDRNHFRHYSISYAETSPLTKEQKYRYFLKLNTTGTPVDPEHIKKVYKMWLREKKKNG
jgi:hypothetical protein